MHIYKKYVKAAFLTAALTQSISLAHAGFSFPNGFYIGPAAAITSNTFKSNLDFSDALVENAGLYTRNSHFSTTQVQPGFLLGYEGIIQNQWLLSAEFQANFLKSYSSQSGNDYINNVTTANNHYAVQLRAGTNLGQSDFIYILAGLARTQTSTNIIFDNTNAAVGSLSELALASINSTRNLSGLKLGVGYEKHINDNFGIRIDYSHINYGLFKNAALDSDPLFEDVFDPLGYRKVSQTTDMLNLTVLFLT